MFEEIAEDTRSSASLLTGMAARRLAQFAEASTAEDPGSFWDELLDACRELIEAKREMASIVNLVGRVLAATERTVLSGLSPDVARGAVFMQCHRAWELAEASLECLGKEGAALLPEGGTVATLSASESVRAVLTQCAGGGKEVRVFVSESRPAREGVEFATSLPAWNIPVTVVTDAALPSLVEGCDLVLVGADSVSEESFVNKTGTYALALAAREADVPFHVAALLDKFIPVALRGDPGRLMDEHEILDDRPGGVAVENRYFESVPTSLVTSIVTEDGVLEPSRVGEKLTAHPIAPALLELLFPRRKAPATSPDVP
jgi:ribose 1,5-bisphosphate isomerase